MLNIVKMDFRRMFKSKTFYVVNLTLILFVIITASVLRFSYNIDYEVFKKSGITILEQSEESDELKNLSEEQYIAMQQDLISSVNVKKILEYQYSSFVSTALLSIFIVLFIAGEIDTGFIKNIIPLNKSRSNLLVSKNIIMIFFVLSQAVLALILAVIGSFIVTNEILFVNISDTIVYLSLQLALRIAFGSFLNFVTYLLKAKISALLIGILLALNIHVMLIGALGSYLYNVNFNFIKYSLMANASISEFQNTDYGRIIMVSIFSFIFYNFMSLIRLKRLEFK